MDFLFCLPDKYFRFFCAVSCSLSEIRLFFFFSLEIGQTLIESSRSSSRSGRWNSLSMIRIRGASFLWQGPNKCFWKFCVMCQCVFFLLLLFFLSYFVQMLMIYALHIIRGTKLNSLMTRLLISTIILLTSSDVSLVKCCSPNCLVYFNTNY